MFETLVEQSLDQLWLVFVVFLRIGPAMAVSPGYGERTVSMRVRLVLGLVFAAAISPVVEPYIRSEPTFNIVLLRYLFLEVLIGFFFGLIAKGVMQLIEIAGAIISQMTSISQMFAGNAEASSIMANIMTVTGLAIIFASPLGTRILEMFFHSYLLDSPTLPEIYAYFAETLTKMVNYIFKHGFLLGSGIVGIFLIYNIFTGFVNKAMPQFMIIFVGVPFVALLSIFVLSRSFELILTSWQAKAMTILTMPLGDL